MRRQLQRMLSILSYIIVYYSILIFCGRKACLSFSNSRGDSFDCTGSLPIPLKGQQIGRRIRQLAIAVSMPLMPDLPSSGDYVETLRRLDTFSILYRITVSDLLFFL